MAGFFGVYTFTVRGGVFCNAQTANVVLFAMSLGTGDWHRALYLLIPMSAYLMGAVVSEIFSEKLAHNKHLQWGVAFIGLEFLAVLFLGFLPKSAPDQICQVVLNFVCSMQFNTFRKSEGTPMATTFVTNHIRQTGCNLAHAWMDNDPQAARLWKLHVSMICVFIVGGLAASAACRFFDVRAIWGALPVLLYILIRLIAKIPSQN